MTVAPSCASEKRVRRQLREGCLRLQPVLRVRRLLKMPMLVAIRYRRGGLLAPDRRACLRRIG